MPFILALIVAILLGSPVVVYLKGIDSVAAAEAKFRNISYKQAVEEREVRSISSSNALSSDGFQTVAIGLIVRKTQYQCRHSKNGSILTINRTPANDGKEITVDINGRFLGSMILANDRPAQIRSEFHAFTGTAYLYETEDIGKFGTNGYFRGHVMGIYPQEKRVLITVDNKPRTDVMQEFTDCRIINI